MVDAGALDLLPDKVPPQVVVTPHAGELARMLTRLGKNEVGVDEVRAQPLACARKLRELTGATVLLKGAVTMVVGADGESNERVILSGRAPAWMSTAGSGDVLAGMLGACSRSRTTCLLRIRHWFPRSWLPAPTCMVLREQSHRNPNSADGIVRKSTVIPKSSISEKSAIQSSPAILSTVFSPHFYNYFNCVTNLLNTSPNVDDFALH